MNAAEIANGLHKSENIISISESILSAIVFFIIGIVIGIVLIACINSNKFFVTTLIVMVIFGISVAIISAGKSSYKEAIKSAVETKVDIIYENQTLDCELLMSNFSEIDWSYIEFNNKDNKIIIEQLNESSQTEDKMHRLYNQNVLQKCKKKEN